MGKKILIILVGIAIAAGGAWCYMKWVHVTSIGDLLKSPRSYDRKIITISGDVTNRTNLLAVKFFTLKDGSGEIAVVTERVLPNIGEKVRVRGRVKEAFALGDTQLIVFVEVVTE
jgi:aspartyl/asparaginyl-tRNA synthetase